MESNLINTELSKTIETVRKSKQSYRNKILKLNSFEFRFWEYIKPDVRYVEKINHPIICFRSDQNDFKLYLFSR